MDKIIKDTFEFNSKLDSSLVIKDDNGNTAIPILWFGDLEAYRKSPIKILTVGINPSDIEFKNNKGGIELNFRFPDSTEIDLNNPDYQKKYTDILNGYFKKDEGHHPYMRWFNKNESALNGLGASYFSGSSKLTSIHIDLRAPIATPIKWSDIEKYNIDEFNPGIGIFNRLVNELQPDIMLMPISIDQHIAKVFGKMDWEDLGYGYLKLSRVKLDSKKDCVLINGSNDRVGPFMKGVESLSLLTENFKKIKKKLQNEGMNFPPLND